MAVQQGMDSVRIREIADKLDGEAVRLGDVLTRGNSSASILEANWGGEDGQKLLLTWRTDASKQITSATELLRTAVEDLERNADEQDDASGESRGGSGGSGGPGGPGGSGGSGGSGSGGSGSGDDDAKPGDTTWSPERDKDSPGVKTNTDADGNKHHYDPLTGKSWVESEDGTWESETDASGRTTRTDITETDHGDGHKTTRESTRGPGEWGEKWETEWTDEGYEKPGSSVLDDVQTEPLVKKDLWNEEASAEVWDGKVGDENLGASAEVLSAEASTSGEAGISMEDGAYVKANAEAGAYLAKGEAHYQNEYGTEARGEAYIGAEASAEGQASIGPGGAKVDAGVEAFAGGKAEVNASQDIGDYGSVGAGAEVSYGIGAHANVDGEISADRIGVSVDVGATLGIGAGVNFDVSVSPSEIISDIGDAGQAFAESDWNPGNWW